MYCQACGSPTAQTLNYCNRCGSSLTPSIKTPVSKLVGLAWTLPLAMAVITLGGLGMVTFIGYQIAQQGASLSITTAVLLLIDVLVIVVIDWMLLRQLSRVIDISRPQTQVANGNPHELNGKSPQQIESMREPASFVTEHTTRVFDTSKRS